MSSPLVKRRPGQRVCIWLLVSAGLLGGGGVWLTSKRAPEVSVPLTDVGPAIVATDGYVGSESCRDCHQHEYATWHATYHRSMTQQVTPDNLKVELDGLKVHVKGEQYSFTRQGDEYFVDLPPDGVSPERRRERLALMTGSHHMHVFWHETSSGRRSDEVTNDRTLGMVPIFYRIDEGSWIPRESAFLQATYGPIEGETGRWNEVCLRCHTTHPRSRQDYETSTFDTHVAELGITCEACHGPGSAHCEDARAIATGARSDGDGRSAVEGIVNPADLDHRRASQVCGQCHSVFLCANQDAATISQNGFRFRPGETLDSSSLRHVVRCSGRSSDPVVNEFLEAEPQFISESFWSDGMVRVSGREYNGLLESPCYQRGTMSCLSCHRLHQSADDSRPTEEWTNDLLGVDMASNQACLQCHSEIAEDVTAHTHHAVGSSGSDCMNCHMPHTTYGLLKAIRSHEISSPGISAAVETGRPLACSLCHLDRPLAWSRDYLAAWYDQAATPLSEEQSEIADSVRLALKGDAGQRALVAWAFGWQPTFEHAETDWRVPFLLTLMSDRYDAIRQIAQRSLSSLPEAPETEFDFLASPDQRNAELSRVLDEWKSRSTSRSARPAVLIGPDGSFQQDKAGALLRERDNRPVWLTE